MCFSGGTRTPRRPACVSSAEWLAWPVLEHDKVHVIDARPLTGSGVWFHGGRCRDLGGALSFQGKLAESEPITRDTLARSRRVFGTVCASRHAFIRCARARIGL